MTAVSLPRRVMIVRPHGPALLCITQPDHARLSAQIMSAWRADGWPDRPTRDAALLAIAHHDEGWIDEDAHPTRNPDTGRPYDFLTLPVERRLAIWTRGPERLAATSTYAAALVAQHGVSITRLYGRDPGWEALLPAIERERDRWYASDPRQADVAGPLIDPAGADRLLFLRDYAMLALGDLLSLMFCHGKPDAAEREGYVIARDDANAIVVAPDPFDGAIVPLSVEARVLPVQTVASDEALVAAWTAAPRERLTGTLRGGALP